MSMLMCTCGAQSDSMREKRLARSLGKGDGKGVRVVVVVVVGGRGDNKGRETRERERGKEDEGITKLKTNVISAASKRKQLLLLGEACLAACSRTRPVQHVVVIKI